MQPLALPVLLTVQCIWTLELNVETDDQRAGGEIKGADQRHVDDLALGGNVVAVSPFPALPL